jgi:nitroimidazol reductase NimA-like FMN-containing flavoprotein (pyridoxamine 5'-phosphate oxidase superfamily)
MEKDAKKKIEEYLLSHYYVRLATLKADGNPLVHTVGYASEGAVLYIMTDRPSRKARNIMNNPNVAYAVDENYDDFLSIKGIQMEGKARIVPEKAEIEKARGLLVKKFKQYSTLPPNRDIVIIKIEPVEGYYLDNSVRFGHRERITF